MRTTSKFMAVALAAALQPAVANTVTVNFDVTSNVVASGYTSNGVSFSGDAWAVRSAYGDCNGSLNFSGSVGCGALLLQDANGIVDPDADTRRSFVINFADGFVNDVAFLFQLGRNTISAPTVEIFSELGATGARLLGSTALSGNTCTNNTGRLFCDPWDQYVSSAFSGVARSIRISGYDQTLVMDELRLTAATTTNRLPEPTSAALVLGALGALGWSRKRSAAR